MSTTPRGLYQFEGRQMTVRNIKVEYGIVYGEVAIRAALVAGHTTLDSMIRSILAQQQRAAARCLQGSRKAAKKHSSAFRAAQ